jgi:hypothetical protein
MPNHADIRGPVLKLETRILFGLLMYPRVTPFTGAAPLSDPLILTEPLSAQPASRRLCEYLPIWTFLAIAHMKASISRAMAVSPRPLHQEPPGMAVARLGNLALTPVAPAGVFAGVQSHIRCQLPLWRISWRSRQDFNRCFAARRSFTMSSRNRDKSRTDSSQISGTWMGF